MLQQEFEKQYYDVSNQSPTSELEVTCVVHRWAGSSGSPRIRNLLPSHPKKSLHTGNASASPLWTFPLCGGSIVQHWVLTYRLDTEQLKSISFYRLLRKLSSLLLSHARQMSLLLALHVHTRLQRYQATRKIWYSPGFLGPSLVIAHRMR
jgi:hypothetical protein